MREETQRWREKNPDYDKQYYARNRERRIREERAYRLLHGQPAKKRVIRFLGRQIPVGVVARTGICAECGQRKFTNIHHEQYDLVDPLRHTVELCVACHMQRHRSTVCRRGHPLSGENLYIARDGSRRCRTCSYAAARRRYAKRKEFANV